MIKEFVPSRLDHNNSLRPTQRLVEQTEIHQLQVHRFISGTLRGITSHETCDRTTTWYLKYLN